MDFEISLTQFLLKQTTRTLKVLKPSFLLEVPLPGYAALVICHVYCDLLVMAAVEFAGPTH